MTNILLNSVKVPYSFVRGTIKQRQDKANKLVETLAVSIKTDIKDGKIHISKLQEHVRNILPKNLDVRVKETYSNDFLAFSDVLHDSSGKVTATTMEFRTIDHHISSHLMEDIVHEFQHVSDLIYHPKYLARNQYMANQGMYTNKYNNLYDTILYNPEYPQGKKDKKDILKKIEHKMKNFLRGYPAEDKLHYIQDARYTLQMEKQAYSVQNKYADVKEDINSIFMFDEKLALLKRMGFEIAKDERRRWAHRMK